MSGQYEQGADGTLVAEFRLAEDIHRTNIIADNYKALTCATSIERAFYQCADVAGPGTISLDEASLWSTNAEDLYYGVLSGYLDPSDASPFGVSCSGTHLGDGVVNSFDIAVFIFAMFARPPYDVALTTLTVDIRSDHSSECSGSNTRSDWQVALGSSYCPSGRRRLGETYNVKSAALATATATASSTSVATRTRHLSTRYYDDATDGVKLERWVDLERGSWFRISIDGLQQITELFLGNVWVDVGIGIVNQPYPSMHAESVADYPADPNQVEIRWARRFELLGMGDDGNCQSIVNGVSGSISLYGDTLSVRQEGPASQQMCAFDLFVYKPNAMTSSRASLEVAHRGDTNLQVMRGSTWRNVQGVGTLTADVSLLTLAELPSPPSPPHSPVVDPELPQTPSSASGSLIGVVIAVIGSILVSVLCCGIWMRAMRAKSDKCPDEPPRDKTAAHRKWQDECNRRKFLHTTPPLAFRSGKKPLGFDEAQRLLSP